MRRSLFSALLEVFAMAGTYSRQAMNELGRAHLVGDFGEFDNRERKGSLDTEHPPATDPNNLHAARFK